MPEQRSCNFRRLGYLACCASLITALAISSGLAVDKKKPTKGASSQKEGRVIYDVSKLVWPNPPAIARVKYVTQLTGEKIDWAAFEKLKKKPKQGWMDRIAGDKPIQDRKDVKIPYQLIRVYGVAVDSKGKIYAADQGVAAIFVFDLESKDVKLIRNGHEASFGLINGIAIDDDDRLFISDTKLKHVLVMNAKHEMVTSFGGDVMASPAGITIDTENRLLYVVDTQRDQVLVYSPDTYKLLRTIGLTGKKHTLTDAGNFSLPTNVAVDQQDGTVFVTDTLNNRVEMFDASGNYIGQFGKPGDGPGSFARPKGVAVDCDGHIWVVDSAQQRVQVFDRSGQLLIYFGGPGGRPAEFNEAYGIAIDRLNRVIVSEQYIGRVQVFRYVPDAEAEELRKKTERVVSSVPPEHPAGAAYVDAKGQTTH